MRRIIKKQKQKPISIEEPPSMVEPPPCDDSADNSNNRIHIRRNIINELDLIKQRVNRIIQNYEAESQPGVYSSELMSVPLQNLEDLLRQYESSRALKEKEISATINFFRKCTYLATCLEEAVLAAAQERTNDKSIPRTEEFESALHNTTEMLQKIKSLNAQMIANLSDIIESQKLKSQSEKAKASESQNWQRHDKIISMYTNEAIKCEKLGRTVATISDELDLVKSHNLNLMEQVEDDKLKLQESESARKELDKIVKKLRVEINILKHQNSTVQQQTPMDNLPSQTAVLSDVPKKPEAKSVLISRLKSSSLLTQSPTSNITDQQNKNAPSKASLYAKRQAATKHASRLLDQQLNYVEELMLQGQQNVIISEKQLSDLSVMTNDALKQKYQEEYTCLCDSVNMISLLLGSEGSEKLTAALESAAPEKLLAEETEQPDDIYEKISRMKTFVSRVMMEMKLFIKLKKRLIASSKGETELQKKVTEVQKWLEYELSEIDREITESVQLYEFDRKEIEKSQVIHLDQLSTKIKNSTQKLSKTLEKLKIPDYTGIQKMLENISTTVVQLRKRPATALVDEFPLLETDKDRKKLVEDTIVSNIPAIDELRKNAASHVKAKHNVTISSKPWRARAYKKLPIIGKKRKTSIRQHYVPTLATFVELSRDGSTTKVISGAASRMINLPSIQRPKTSEVPTYRANSRNQKSAQIFPTIKKVPVTNLTITGRKSL